LERLKGNLNLPSAAGPRLHDGQGKGFRVQAEARERPSDIDRPAVSTQRSGGEGLAVRAVVEQTMAGVRLLLAVLASSACALQPVLRFRDPKTRGEVVLVGCMHYNPVSIALASSVVRKEV